MIGLTERQVAILDYMRSFTNENGRSPSLREIGREFDISSLRGVAGHLNALCKKGYVKHVPSGSYQVIRTSEGVRVSLQLVPVFGEVTA